MKELSSRPRSRHINLTSHHDPLASFSDHEDSGPVEMPADTRSRPGHQVRPHEVLEYISVGGNRSFEAQDTAHDWSMGHAVTWEDVEEAPLYHAHRYEPRQPRTVQIVATVAVCGLLGYSLYLDRPDVGAIRSWLTGRNVIELPAIDAPPPASRLGDEPGRVAAAPLDPVPVPEAEPAAPAAVAATGAAEETAPSSRLELVVGDAGVSIMSGRARKDDPLAREIKPQDPSPAPKRSPETSPLAKPSQETSPAVKPSQATSPAAKPSPAALTQALNAASLAPEAKGGTTDAAASPTRGDDAPVRRVLTRFQVAYNALDVEGTRQVWPTVDTTALGHVFQSLASQHLELTGCQVSMAGDRAQATCSGQARMVPKDQTITEALLRAGVEVLTSCEQGVCGTCITRVLEGIPDHRDLYFTPEEQAKNDQFTPCCSRSKSPLLVLDL